MISNSYAGNDKSDYFYYRELFGTSRIVIETIDSSGLIDPEELYETDVNWSSKNSLFLPVVIYDAIDGSNSFGVINIEKYS